MKPYLVTLFLALPLCSAFVLSILGAVKKNDDNPRARFFSVAVSVIAPVFTLALAVYVFVATYHLNAAGRTSIVYKFGGWPPPLGVVWSVDALSALLLLVINTLSLLVVIYSVGYIKKFSAREKYFALINLMIGAMNALALSGDLFNLFVFLEIASISTYALTAYTLSKDGLEASFKYVILGSTASSFILLGITIIYALTGTLNLAGSALALSDGKISSSNAVTLAAVLMTAGYALKSGLMPFHSWLPDVHSSAPSPVSALLSGILIKVAGLYSIARIFFTLAPFSKIEPSVLVFIGVLSMIGGVLLALGQWDFKRLLAYHSISQVGYIALGLGLATPLGFIGAIYHLVNHAAFKSLLFLNAGSVEYATSNRNLKQMGGLSSRMPVTGLTSLVASMSIAGIPPLNGFWSKLIIIIAAFSSGHYFAGGIAALVSFLTLASFLKVQRYAFWGEYIPGNDTASSRPVKESPLSMTAPMAALALICIALGIFYPQVRRIFIEPAASTIVNVSAYPSDILASAPPSPTQSVATVK